MLKETNSLPSLVLTGNGASIGIFRKQNTYGHGCGYSERGYRVSLPGKAPLYVPVAQPREERTALPQVGCSQELPASVFYLGQKPLTRSAKAKRREDYSSSTKLPKIA